MWSEPSHSLSGHRSLGIPVRPLQALLFPLSLRPLPPRSPSLPPAGDRFAKPCKGGAESSLGEGERPWPRAWPSGSALKLRRSSRRGSRPLHGAQHSRSGYPAAPAASGPSSRAGRGQKLAVGATVLWFSFCLRESAVNLVRSGSYTRQLRRDEAKGSETPQTTAPSTYVSTYLRRYQARRAEAAAHSGHRRMAITAHL